MQNIPGKPPYNDIGGITTIFLIGSAIIFIISISFPLVGTILGFFLWLLLIGIIDGNFTEIRGYIRKLEKRLAEYEKTEEN